LPVNPKIKLHLQCGCSILIGEKFYVSMLAQSTQPLDVVKVFVGDEDCIHFPQRDTPRFQHFLCAPA
jgi:predicted CoA-binding protein